MGGGQRLHTAMQWMIQRVGWLEIPGSTINLLGDLASFCFSVYRLRYLCTHAVNWCVGYLYKFGFARSEVTDLWEIIHSDFSFSGLVKGPKPLINSLHAPSSGRFNLRDLSARRGVVLYAYRTHTDSALTSIPSGAISFCQEHSGLPVTRFCLLKSD